ncbi:MAG TPA: OmpA family protein [Verrucomicrobiae bacterium]|jgi:peptidoglycan-associated lipoprotein|nr:OmpA family protein [Verrucomicrobiae bacterium]
MNKFTYSAALALAVAIASAGCAHKPYGVTPIPPRPEPYIGDQNPPTLPQQPLPPSQPVTETPAYAEKPFSLPDWNQDRNALAAETIHFSFDSAVIRDSERSKLQAIAAALNSDKSANLMIEGNCDERGTEEYNRSLGERRAEAAREALVGMGVDVDRIHTVSYGKDHPVEHGHSEAVWSKNRRADFVVLHRKTGT